MKFAKTYIFVLVFLISACDTSAGRYGYESYNSIKTSAGKLGPGDKYGTEARAKAQEGYLEELDSNDYITQQQSWDEKLKVRKQQFNNTLKREYLGLSTDLAKQKNYTDSTYFRRKGLDAEKADFDLFPEDPARWIVESDEEMEDLRAARLNLIDSLVGYTPVADPLDSSKAIVYYDCWVQQAQSKSLKLTKDNCKQKYQATYNKLAGVSRNIENKNVAAISEEYKWVNIDKPVYDKVLRPELYAAQQKAAAEAAKAKEQSNELYKVEYTSPKVSSLKQPVKKSIITTKTTETKTVETTKPSMAYTPAPKANGVVKTTPVQTTTTTKTTTTTTTKPAEQVTAVVTPPAPPVVGPLPAAKVVEDKSLITDQSDKKPELVYMVYFDGKSDQLTDKDKAELDKALEEIKKNAPSAISVNGHTDRSFGSGESLITSKKRADATRDYLLSKGISRDMIRTYGFGKTDNIIDNPEGQAVPANNRAEVVFKGANQ